MIKPNEDFYKIRIREMEAMVLLSRGMSQCEVAAKIGCEQPYITKIVRKISEIYGIKLTEGAKSNYRLSEDGLRIAAQFDVALRVLQGREESGKAEQVQRLVKLKMMVREIIDHAESI